MQPSDDWVVERQRAEDLVGEAGRQGTPEAREAAKVALDAFVERFPQKAEQMIAFRRVLDREPLPERFGRA